MDVKNFAASMKEYREQLGLTQKELSRLTSLSPATISSYENGTKFPALENAISIADVLGMSLDDLRDKKLCRCTTYADAFKTILMLIEKLNAKIVGCNDSFVLAFDDAVMSEMLEGIKTVKSVFGDSEIEKELYDIWVDKKINEYSQQEVNNK